MEGYIKSVDEVLELIHARTTFEPEQAQAQGLVTQIKSDLLPLGASLFSIYDVPQQQTIPSGIPMFRGFSIPEPQNHTAITNSYTSIAY